MNNNPKSPKKVLTPEEKKQQYLKDHTNGVDTLYCFKTKRAIKVSPEDFDRVVNYRWYTRTYRYAVTNRIQIYAYGIPHDRTKSKEVGSNFSLHRFIVGGAKGMVVDHIDGNTLNNTRTNLRMCTHSQNLFNSIGARNKKGYKGVYPKELQSGEVIYAARCGGKYLGCFENEKAAALAYNKAAYECAGMYAKLNEVN